MKRRIVVLSMVSILLLVVFLGCDMGTTGSNQTPGSTNNPPAIIEFPDIKALDVSAYEAATLEDLKPFNSFVSEDEGVDGWPEESLERDSMAIATGINILMESIGYILDEEISSFSPITQRSIAAGLQLQIRDEGFRIEYDDDEDSETPDSISETIIDHLDIVLDGEINSLTDLLALMAFEDDTITTALTMDGRIQISGKMQSMTDEKVYGPGKTNQIASVLSLFVDLQIEASDLETDTPSSLLSGRVLLSSGANVMASFDSEGTTTLYHSPVILQMEIAPFSDVNIAALIDAVSDEMEEDTPNPWPIIKTQMWGEDATGNLVTITRIIGSFDANTILKTDTWTNEMALNLILALMSEDD